MVLVFLGHCRKSGNVFRFADFIMVLLVLVNLAALVSKIGVWMLDDYDDQLHRE